MSGPKIAKSLIQSFSKKALYFLYVKIYNDFMLVELKPTHSKNGLIGRYRLPTGDKYFGVLLFESMPDEKREEAIARVNVQIAEMYQADEEDPDIIKLSKIARRNFTIPEQVIFEPNTYIQDVLQDRLSTRHDILFICPNKEIYVQACAAIGITRADHLVSAELHALTTPESIAKNLVIGNAQKLIQDLYKEQRLRISLSHALEQENNPSVNQGAIDAFKESRESVDRFIDSIPTSTKFQLGYVPLNDYHRNCDPKKPWLFRPPFKKCLFEFDISIKRTETSDITHQKAFALIEELSDSFFRATIAISLESVDISPNNLGRIGLNDHYITWDISGETVKVGVVRYGNLFDPDPHTTIRMGANFFKSISTAIVKLNSLKTKIEKTHPSKGLQKKLQGPSCYYDYHILVPEPKTEAAEPLPGQEAPPRRLHKRRGHYRTYENERYTLMRGKTVWIEEKIWGDENIGVLGKEYDLSNLPSTNSPT